MAIVSKFENNLHDVNVLFEANSNDILKIESILLSASSCIPEDIEEYNNKCVYSIESSSKGYVLGIIFFLKEGSVSVQVTMLEAPKLPVFCDSVVSDNVFNIDYSKITDVLAAYFDNLDNVDNVVLKIKSLLG